MQYADDLITQSAISHASSSCTMSAQTKTYHQTFAPTLKQSNATQNIYFSNFFEWQGATRERWFYECIANNMLEDKGVFVTKKAQNTFIREVFPFQTVICELNAREIRKCSFYLLFRFYVDGQLVSSGYQQLVFASKDKKIAKLPDEILERIRRFEG